ncbi:MAG: response regulator [Bacteroidota bacterium]|nr:response regulator [Candidatus Kapabacteria bacterium]MDW8219864.1 response regulator [Bacteroidota bacterium]
MPKTALVVDDTEMHRSATRTYLIMSGFKVDVANDGLEAMKLLNTKTFDLIVADIEMPNMNGMELLKRIRNHKQSSATPVIMLSTLDSPEMQTKLKQLGANYYLVKPFTGERIKAALQAVGL